MAYGRNATFPSTRYKLCPFALCSYELFPKKVHFLLNIPGRFGIIHTALEKADSGAPHVVCC